jgi:hypothetical protein
MTNATVRTIWAPAAPGVKNRAQLIATAPAGSIVTKIDVRGVLNDITTSVTFAAGSWTSRNHATGLQWGAAGYTPVQITATPVSTGNWLKFADGSDPAAYAFIAEAAQAYIDTSFLAVVERWRGQLYCPVSTDFHWCFGGITALGSSNAWLDSGASELTYATYP